MSEMEKLKERFRAKKAQGLVDIKFFVAGDKLSPERIAASANQLDDLVEQGHCTVHAGWAKPEQTDIGDLLG